MPVSPHKPCYKHGEPGLRRAATNSGVGVRPELCPRLCEIFRGSPVPSHPREECVRDSPDVREFVPDPLGAALQGHTVALRRRRGPLRR